MVLNAGVRKNKLLTRAAARRCNSHSMINTAAIDNTTTAHANDHQKRAVSRTSNRSTVPAPTPRTTDDTRY